VKGRRIETVRVHSDQPWPQDALVALGLAHPLKKDGQELTSDLLEEQPGHIP